MKAFYHSADLDGHCSGAVVKMKHPECEMIGINYGDVFPWDDIQDGETVYMVDFSLQPFNPNMVILNKKCDLVWIDHHISAIDEFGKTMPKGNIRGFRKDGIGACQLTYEYLFAEKAPDAVRLLAEYDVWNHKDPKTLPFQFGMRLYDTFPNDPKTVEWWKCLMGFGNLNPMDQIIGEGSVVLDYLANDNKKYAQACSFEIEWKGLFFIAINRMLTNSQMFDSVYDPLTHDAMLTFGFRKGKWTISMYSMKENVDVSVIAKEMGGGGHKGASGFQCKELPFELPVI